MASSYETTRMEFARPESELVLESEHAPELEPETGSALEIESELVTESEPVPEPVPEHVLS